jgi:hypothetical protein
MGRNYLTVVSGLPRSGTSMMMRMLDEGGIPALTDDIRKADIDNPKGYYEFEPVKRTRQDPSWLEQSAGKVVKMVARLLMDLPRDREYRVVFMKRKLEEVVRSQNVMLEHKGKAQEQLRDDQVLGLFRQELQQIDLFLKTHPNFRFIYVDYNRLLSEPAAAVETIDEFLGGLDTRRMLAVVDPALYRQRA